MKTINTHIQAQMNSKHKKSEKKEKKRKTTPRYIIIRLCQ